MAFPSSVITECPQTLSVTDRTFGYRSEFESGHVLSRSRTTRAIKIFEVEWVALPQAQYLKFVEFFRDNGNHTAFDWPWPLTTDYTDANSTCDAGFSSSAISVRFVESDLRADYNKEIARWQLRVTLEEV